MTIYVFGNPDLEMDSLPLKMLPDLETKFPSVRFIILDPNEEWFVPRSPEGEVGEMLILDTAIGIEEVTIFDSLEKFAAVPRVSVHDFDALTNLRYLKKLGKINEVKIIAVPASNLSTPLETRKTLSEMMDSVGEAIARLAQ